MNETGRRSRAWPIEKNGVRDAGKVHYNLLPPELYEEALRRGEARLSADGALVAATGQHTGRSAKDKFTVRDAGTDDASGWTGAAVASVAVSPDA